MKSYKWYSSCFFLILALGLATSPTDSKALGSIVYDPLALDWSQVAEAQIEEDYERLGYPQSPGSQGFVQWSLNDTVASTGRNYTIHVGSLSSGLPDAFSFRLPSEGEGMAS